MSVDYELQAADDGRFQFTVTVSYTFLKKIDTERFVVFATSSSLLRDVAISGSPGTAIRVVVHL